MKKTLTHQEQCIRNWITRNRGILTRIAVQCHVCPQFVQSVAYGNSTALPGNQVEKVLRSQGWPGIRRKKGEVEV